MNYVYCKFSVKKLYYYRDLSFKLKIFFNVEISKLIIYLQ